ncbi:PAN2-PAN3 deadenylation complex catalytic subunit PAN2 isoform 3-T3 [Rhinophrynus dorsalis]
MNFDGLDPALAEYAPTLHAPLDTVLDPHLNPNLLQSVELDHDGVGLEGLPVQDPVRIMEGMYSELHTAVSEVGVPVSAVHFDLHEEMLWLGNHGGHAASFFSPALERYSSFKVHATNDIRQIQSLDNGVLFLTKNNLKLMTRGGLTIFDYMMDENVDNHSLLLTDSNTLLMGGMQNHVIQMDLNTVQETQKYTTEVPGITIMRQSSRFFFCGHTSGKLTLRDLRTFKAEQEFDAYSGSLSDFDVHGNLVVTCGFSSRMNVLSCDRFLKVYDLRMMRAITPLQVHVDPLFLRFIPTYTSRLAIISQRGQCQFCEPTGLASPADIFHVSTVSQAIMSFDVSASKQVLAFGDSDGCVHLWADTHDATFNTYSRDTEFALPCMVDNLPHLDWIQDLMPLSFIPVPLTNETLLSDWPSANSTPAPRRAPPVDPEILRTMKQVGFIGYSPNPRTKLRNQVPYQLENEFDSFSQVPESPIGREEEPHLYMVAKKYRKVTIKYSKLGLEDFDFKHYNKTLFAGLEPHIPNAYCNSMIQVMYLLEPVRCLVQNHLCQKEFCLSCELGFLFHMLDLSRGDPCQASNFLRAFRTIPEAAALGLILADSDEATGKINLGRLIQSWCRFLLTQLHQETQELEGPQAYRGVGSSSSFTSSGGSVISQLFGCEVENCSMCRCGKETVRLSTTLLFTLSYPETNSNDKVPQDFEFVEVLRRSICLEQNTQAWCENCEKYQPTIQTRNIRCLPDVLVINCEVNSVKEAEFWRMQAEYAFKKALRKAELKFPDPKETNIGEWNEFSNSEELPSPLIPSVEELRNVWVPCSLKMNLSKNKDLEVLNCTENEEQGQSDEEKDEATNVYDLMATVVHILDPRTGGSLVAHIKVGETYHQRKEGVTHQQWYLFNDFLIEPVDKYEAVQFDMTWKVPAILFYSKRNLNTKYNLTIKNPIETSVLLAEASLARKQRKCHATFIPLQLNEMPQAAELVGLDAEFVTLNQEEAELRSDGTKSTIKPSQMSVARITCVRGQGPNEGVPFIDDYISTQEQVPKDQVIDTVYLFHMPRKRMISLRYLAWYFLDLKIQGETHDSIEDARTALQLYRKYMELSRNGTEPENFRKVLKGLYEKGRKMDWKVPEPESQNSPKNSPVYSSVVEL